MTLINNRAGKCGLREKLGPRSMVELTSPEKINKFSFKNGTQQLALATFHHTLLYST